MDSRKTRKVSKEKKESCNNDNSIEKWNYDGISLIFQSPKNDLTPLSF